jgi:hypothetical protein
VAVELKLFLGLWFLFGLLIQSGDLEAFNLQHMGIEAMVERHQLSVDGSPTPQLQPAGDVFEHDGRLYAAKQPGQFFAGSLVYFLLHLLGISYLTNYLLAGALTTFFTVSLVTAVAAVCVFRLARDWVDGSSVLWPWLSVLAFSLGSIALPYSGVMHHDALATAYLAIAFYLATRVGHIRKPIPTTMAIGFLLGWTITTSMLSFFPAVVIGLYVLSLYPIRLLPWAVLGGSLGLAPLFAYNWISFGHPLLVPNVAGDFSDTFFFLDWRNFTSKVRFYAGMLTMYAPVFWLGLAGLALFPSRLRREQMVLCALHLALMGYVFNVETIAGCQYGPRYLLPLMPFAALGLIGFSHLSSAQRRRGAAVVVGLVLAVSIVINFVGALYGAMFCDLRRYAFAHYVEAIRHGVFRTFPLSIWLVVPIGLWLAQLAARWGLSTRGTVPLAGAGGRGTLRWVVLALYLVSLILWRDTVPAGLNNDAAEETLRGILLLEHGRFEVITDLIGIPQETLYLYLAGAVAEIFGTTTLAVQLTSWGVGLAIVYLLYVVARRVDVRLPPWVALLVAVSSIWLFHYARAGVRAISAPFFLLSFCLLLDRSERAPQRNGPAFAAGCVLGLSVYAYTSCRVLVLAVIVDACVRLLRAGPKRAPLVKRYAAMAAGTLIVSLPNLWFFAQAPREFLLRGEYVAFGGLAVVPQHLLWSLLLPFTYGGAYRTLTGPGYISDGVSAGLVVTGIDPLHPLVAAAFLGGLVVAWKHRERAVVSILLWMWPLSVLLLGFSGPSLTRLLILLPVFLIFAMLGLAALLRRWPRARGVVLALLLLVVVWEARQYFVVFARMPEAQSYFSSVATPMGQRARELAEQGQRVVCVVAKDASVLRYLTHDDAGSVRVVEFYQRPLDPRAIPIVSFQPQVLLIERAERFAGYTAVFPPQRHVGTRGAFDEIRLAGPD